MTELYSKLLALFLVLLVGFFMQRLFGFSASFYLDMNRLTTSITLPALIFVSMDKPFSAEVMQTSLEIIIITSILYAVLIFGFTIQRKTAKKEDRQMDLCQYLILVGNTSFMGYPVIGAVFGAQGIFYGSIFNLVHNVIVFTYGMNLLQKGRKNGTKALLRNPCLIATFAGILLFFSPFQLPSFLADSLQSIGDITIPLCMLYVGAQFSMEKVSTLFRSASVLAVSLVRIVLFPAVLLSVYFVFHLEGMAVCISIIMFSTPAALTSAAFAQQFGHDDVFAGRVVVLSNLLAMFTLPIVFFLLK